MCTNICTFLDYVRPYSVQIFYGSSLKMCFWMLRSDFFLNSGSATTNIKPIKGKELSLMNLFLSDLHKLLLQKNCSFPLLKISNPRRLLFTNQTQSRNNGGAWAVVFEQKWLGTHHWTYALHFPFSLVLKITNVRPPKDK